MGIIICIIAIGLIIYLLSGNSNTYEPPYKKSNTYNSFDNEMKFLVDTTSAVVELVKISKNKSLMKGFSDDMKREYLNINIDNFRIQLKSNSVNIATKYKLPIHTVNRTIDSVCDSAIETYVLNL